jgi:hypothetical protein
MFWTVVSALGFFVLQLCKKANTNRDATRVCRMILNLRANEIHLPDKSIFETNYDMKKIGVLSLFLLVLKLSQAQYSLAFCEGVNAEGQPQHISTSFVAASGGKALTLFVKSDEGFSTEQVKFTVYYVNALGNEEDILSASQATEPGWNYVWKEVVLFDPGTYRVKVYTGKGSYLTSANVNLKAR